MPKMKTNKGAAKRFRRTSKGYKHKRTGKNHLFTGKSSKRKRSLRGFAAVSDGDTGSIDKMIPKKAR